LFVVSRWPTSILSYTGGTFENRDSIGSCVVIDSVRPHYGNARCDRRVVRGRRRCCDWLCDRPRCGHRCYHRRPRRCWRGRGDDPPLTVLIAIQRWPRCTIPLKPRATPLAVPCNSRGTPGIARGAARTGRLRPRRASRSCVPHASQDRLFRWCSDHFGGHAGRPTRDCPGHAQTITLMKVDYKRSPPDFGSPRFSVPRW
jgi:hypothetical protein